MNPDGLVIDASIGSILPGGVQYAINLGLKVYRLNMRAGLSGEIIVALETKELIEIIAGKGEINGVIVTAGDFIGKEGDVVVDSISNPARIIGIADGKGGLISEELERYEESKKRVRSGIAERMIM
jgi:hypothetical protein